MRANQTPAAIDERGKSGAVVKRTCNALGGAARYPLGVAKPYEYAIEADRFCERLLSCRRLYVLKRTEAQMRETSDPGRAAHTCSVDVIPLF